MESPKCCHNETLQRWIFTPILLLHRKWPSTNQSRHRLCRRTSWRNQSNVNPNEKAAQRRKQCDCDGIAERPQLSSFRDVTFSKNGNGSDCGDSSANKRRHASESESDHTVKVAEKSENHYSILSRFLPSTPLQPSIRRCNPKKLKVKLLSESRNKIERDGGGANGQSLCLSV